jgi:hypothetical protein
MRAFLIKGGFRPVERERRKSEKREREREEEVRPIQERRRIFW